MGLHRVFDLKMRSLRDKPLMLDVIHFQIINYGDGLQVAKVSDPKTHL